jgi:hypothetical protein
MNKRPRDRLSGIRWDKITTYLRSELPSPALKARPAGSQRVWTVLVPELPADWTLATKKNRQAL